ncbi:cysteine desulfuration protein SufE [Hasllibacter halocynthiae]|uniref:Cysteine desulfuration protein SufE n=1 Tax=Hasllibacter halocynthiae TaxID=595589 RepID=A0A2T0X7X7_9RHOB|nr:SufE family protein [Hasllibacter halocynthiae]PRY94974.1 cysteine desulfuration protein SufE [Hasllibacter halocynthiae]
MAQPAFEEIVETFEFLEDWEDRYREVIDMGRRMPPMDAALKVPATKVDGCASQVWIAPHTEGGVLEFDGDSDAMIVKGLIAVLHALYAGLPVGEAAGIDARAELARLNLADHLSSQRSNGLRAMIQRLDGIAREAA